MVYDPPESWAGERARLHGEIRWWRDHAARLQQTVNELTMAVVEHTLASMVIEEHPHPGGRGTKRTEEPGSHLRQPPGCGEA